MDYSQRLRDRIGELPDITPGRGRVRLEAYQNPLFRTIADMVDCRGPQFCRKIAVEFAFVLGYDSIDELSMGLKQQYECAEDRFGLQIVSLGDAMKLTHGEYQRSNNLRPGKGFKLSKRNLIFYLDEQKLKEYILRSTHKRVEVIVDLDFPEAEHPKGRIGRF